MLVNDVVGKGNLLEGLSSGDDDFSCGEDATGNLFHIFGGLELYFHCGVSVWFKRHFENVVVLLEPIGDLHEVDVVVEAEVGVDHDHTERIDGNVHLQTQKGFENVDQLRDDAFAVEEITAPGDLNASIGKHFHGFGAVSVVVGERDLVVKGRRLEFPFETIGLRTGPTHFIRTDLFEQSSKSLYVNVLDKARNHSDGRNFDPRRSGLIGKSLSYLIESQEIRKAIVSNHRIHF